MAFKGKSQELNAGFSVQGIASSVLFLAFFVHFGIHLE